MGSKKDWRNDNNQRETIEVDKSIEMSQRFVNECVNDHFAKLNCPRKHVFHTGCFMGYLRS